MGQRTSEALVKEVPCSDLCSPYFHARCCCLGLVCCLCSHALGVGAICGRAFCERALGVCALGGCALGGHTLVKLGNLALISLTLGGLALDSLMLCSLRFELPLDCCPLGRFTAGALFCGSTLGLEPLKLLLEQLTLSLNRCLLGCL